MHPGKIEMIDPEMAHFLRQKSDAERLAIAHGMWRFARNTIRNVLRSQHPDWDNNTLNHEVAKRMSHGAI